MISEGLNRGRCFIEDHGSGYICWANVPDHLLPLAFGAQPAEAGCVTKVPKAWELEPVMHFGGHLLGSKRAVGKAPGSAASPKRAVSEPQRRRQPVFNPTLRARRLLAILRVTRSASVNHTQALRSCLENRQNPLLQMPAKVHNRL